MTVAIVMKNSIHRGATAIQSERQVFDARCNTWYTYILSEMIIWQYI